MHELDAVDLGLLAIDAGGRIVSANRWLRERARVGTPLVGRSLGEVWGDQLDPRLVQAVRECLECGHSVHLSHALHPMPLPLFPVGAPHHKRLRQRVDVVAVAAASPTSAAGASGASRACTAERSPCGDTLAQPATANTAATTTPSFSRKKCRSRPRGGRCQL